MKVSECMSTNVGLVTPEMTLQEAARKMVDLDCGSLPVADNDRLVGMLTDRDIAIRAISKGKGPDTAVREAMTDKVVYCYTDQDVTDVGRIMAEKKVRRLPVLDREKRLKGIVSIGDLSKSDLPPEAAKEALHEVSDDTPVGPPH